ncbi:MAG: hypothetical protein LBH74_06580 [Nitrososphaerota archaeon]|jgi:hypothetical protein|uniref:hypothetical protein n=1 Tax=Candidatus Bathycorpusculum sp. TaxID=2994959 RepID=UPI00282DB6CF|nr:hypothetical protein [Candidatus Termitimicrobium sp.]MCL2431627.1 hypothetical protein [Candidatus Termitimicrobium sp.]MDR0493284.1 hypothetical protein [Nitrososphaerota archaeon]
MEAHCKFLLEAFLASSFSTVKALVEGALTVKGQNLKRKVTLFQYVNDKKVSVPFETEHFYIRGSVEYANPQLTVEEVQGIIGTRLLAACANYYFEHGLHTPTQDDTSALLEALRKPPEGYIVPFLLNTDDVELDRYSMNPLKQSIIDSGQSAIPAANATTDGLKIDETYTKKYNGSLISKKETELIAKTLNSNNDAYIDFVDSIKYHQLSELSKLFDMDLSLYSLRMPLSTLKAEEKNGSLHYIISESNQDYSAVEEAYKCMGRSMNKRTTLLTIPHSKKGYGSKRAARGKLHFENGNFNDATVTYKTTQLYPNDIDPQDISVAVCDDKFSIAGEKFVDYSFAEMPSSPQFFLYSLASPEDAAIWHGVGAVGSSQLLQSYANARNACYANRFIKNLNQKYSLNMQVPLQFNLAPDALWSHPIHHNIDASIGSVENISDLVHRGLKLEYLSAFK